jgi:hypothetical protein
LIGHKKERKKHKKGKKDSEWKEAKKSARKNEALVESLPPSAKGSRDTFFLARNTLTF